LRTDWLTLLRFGLTDEGIQVAGALAERHSLSGFDSIHLAAVMQLREATIKELLVSTWDRRLAVAARAEGLVLAHEVTA
jgi:hypothetical protein